jgi:4-aminobutyrate aminotransferase-like enzyme/Ser/Thr protein kinase RdoA (MazF antagonist)
MCTAAAGVRRSGEGGTRREAADSRAGRAGSERGAAGRIAFLAMTIDADPLARKPPSFRTHAAARMLLDSYRLRGELHPLAGERDQNFRVDAADGQRYLLKISNPADGAGVLDMQTAALAHIERVDPALPVMRTVQTADGRPWAKQGRHIVRLFTFLPGRTVTVTELTPAAIRDHGQTAARLGLALRGFFHPAAAYDLLWSLPRAEKLRPLLRHLDHDARRRAQVERVLDRFDEHVAPALPALRAQVIHGDLSLDNVLFQAGGSGLRVSGIVDFGDMSHAPLVCDLAVTLADVLHGHGDPLGAAELLIRAYTRITPLEEDEADLLGDLVATRLAAEVAITAWRVRIYPGNTAYAASSEPAARAFLDEIERAGADTVARRLRDACLGLPYRRVPTATLLERRRRVLPRSPLFYAQPVHLDRGEGVWLHGADGRRYLDCYNNVQVAGHGHPRIAQAIAQQQRLLTTHSRYLHEAVVELAERLTATLPGPLETAFILNSGSEANDLAWRIARAATGRGGAIVTEHAYHGVTQATHAFSPEEWAPGDRPAHVATIPAPDGYRGRYRRDEPGWELRYAAHVDEAADSLGELGLAALYADPACTADGALVPPPGWLAEAASRTAARGGLVVADEVQAGHGRAGTGLWSFLASGIEPDFVVMGKPMGNGFPVAGLVVRSGLLQRVPAGTELFSTFGGNPVACAAALAVLDVIEEEGLVENAAQTGGYLLEALQALAEAHPGIGDVRGAGLLLAVELVSDRTARTPDPGLATAVAEALRERGVLLGVTGPAGNVLKIRPPLAFRRSHADLLVRSLAGALADVAG